MKVWYGSTALVIEGCQLNSFDLCGHEPCHRNAQESNGFNQNIRSIFKYWSEFCFWDIETVFLCPHGSQKLACFISILSKDIPGFPKTTKRAIALKLPHFMQNRQKNVEEQSRQLRWCASSKRIKTTDSVNLYVSWLGGSSSNTLCYPWSVTAN